MGWAGAATTAARGKARGALALAAALLVAACAGGSTSATDPPAAPSPAASTPAPRAPSAPVTVATSDGTAALALPAGALPDDVAPDAVGIRLIDPPQDVPEGALAPARSYELVPDGLRLSAPATVTLRLTPDDVAAGGVMVLHVSDDSVEGVQATVVDPTAETRELTFEISHFSALAIFTGAAALVEVERVEPVGDTFAVGDTVPFEVVVRPRGGVETIAVEIPVLVGGEWEFRREEWDVGLASPRLTVRRDGGAYSGGVLTPRAVEGIPAPGVFAGVITGTATFTCATAGKGFVTYLLGITREVFRVVGGAGSDVEIEASVVIDASVSCGVEATPTEQALARLLPEGGQLTGTARYEELFGASCRGLPFESTVRIARGTNDVTVTQVHRPGLEQSSQGQVLPSGAIVTIDRETSYDEFYGLRFTIEDEQASASGINVHGPEGAIDLAQRPDALAEALAEVDAYLDEALAGNVGDLVQALGVGEGACIVTVHIELE